MKTLIKDLKSLRLNEFANRIEGLLKQHPEHQREVIEIIKTLTSYELSSKQQRAINYRLDQARFNQIQTVETFNFNYNASTKKIRKAYLNILRSEFIDEGYCGLFFGGSGLGKTHLARACGYYFCQQNIKVRFSTLSQMSNELVNAQETVDLKKVMNQYTKPKLLILDEIGYSRVEEQESNLVFQIISQRYDTRRSTLITSNQEFAQWNQIFHSDAMAHALLDRLIQRSEVFHLEGKSYRETNRKRMNK